MENSDKALGAACMLESISNSLRCCICTDSFTDPRILACGHTFCLQCLEKLIRNSALACPICRRQFSINHEELVELPRNAIILEVIGISNRPSEFETVDQNATSSLSESVPINEADLGSDEYVKFTATEISESSKQLHESLTRCSTFESEQLTANLQDCSIDYRDEEQVEQDDSPCNISTENEKQNVSNPEFTPGANGCNNSVLPTKKSQQISLFSQRSELIDDKFLPDGQEADGLKTQSEIQEDQIKGLGILNLNDKSDTCAKNAPLKALQGELKGHSKPSNATKTHHDDYLKEPSDQKVGLLTTEEIDIMNEAVIKLKTLLPDNPFDTEYVICDICAESDSINTADIHRATWYCIECSEGQCDACTRSHKRQKLSKNHKIMKIDEETKQKLLKKQRITHRIKITCDVCEENSVDGAEDIPEATFHCITCKENQCIDCTREHKRQRMSKDHEIVALDDSLKEKLAEMKKVIDMCDVCAANNENSTTDITVATQFCVICQERQCDQCGNEHKRQKLSKDHHIVPLNDDVRKKYLTEEKNSTEKQTTVMCDQCLETNGKHNIATKYCNDCEENQCFECSEGHKRQKPCKGHIIVPIDETPKCTKNEMVVSNFSKSELNPETSSGNISSTELGGQKSSRQYHKHMNQITCRNISPFLSDARYSKIQQVTDKTSVKEDDLENFWFLVIPYIIQRIKMWNGDVITSQNIDSLVAQSKSEKNHSSGNCGLRSSGVKKNIPIITKQNPISRLDCFTYIINAADSIVAQDILRILSKFPFAIPLIAQDINHKDKYIVTIPLIQNVSIKWESTPGQIAENYLFSSPFRMIVAVRLGNNKIGKSTILNQSLRKQFVFSSCCEAGNHYGRPRTLDGSVEMVWLTQETCSDITWKSTMLEYYKGNMQEVAILANLHGDAFEYEDTLKYLAKLSFSFIVFLMPGFNQKHWAQLKQLLSGKMSVHVLVDPDESSEELYLSKIQTAMLASNDTQKTMRQLLLESLCVEFNLKSSNVRFVSELTSSLTYAETFKDKNCEKIIEMVREHGCFNLRQLLRQIDIEDSSKWDQNLKKLLKLLMSIVDCRREYAKQSLSYFETQLSQLSGKESESAISEVREANEKLRRIVKNPMKSHFQGNSNETKSGQELKDAQEQLQSALEKADKINIGQEHFFRAMGQLYDLSQTSSSLVESYQTQRLPSYMADLLIDGHAIELLNGDSGEIQILWMKAICDSVLKKKPNFKVFVISIIGLQSSGKSTLLNALFSCRFAVSVGRCSRGLYMRMITMDDDLRQACGCDCIILIDTEGLCSPEKMNDPKAHQKDRLMATYAMGISDLTIINVLGEGMTEMTGILQIAIVAMARLRGGGIKPDLLMVQHLQERNVQKIDQAKSQFCEAINNAFELINKNDVEIGCASAECLNELIARIQSGDLFQHFGPFKDGSSVNSPPSEGYHEDIMSLFETLLRRVSASKNCKTFERWSNHFESYWTCVREENFALNFLNVKHITDFLYFEKKIAKVKELLELSIRKHREVFATRIRDQISNFIEEKRKTVTEEMKSQMLDSIDQSIEMIPQVCPDKCEFCRVFNSHYEVLLQEISGIEWEEDTKRSLKKYNEDLRERSKKYLKQTFDGSAVKQGCFSEFSRIITEELKKALDERPNGIYKPEEQQRIMTDIWNLLQGIARSKENRPDPDNRFHQAVNSEYSVMPNIYKNLGTEIICERLFKMHAVKTVYDIKIAKVEWFHYEPFTEDLKKCLIQEVHAIVTNIFQSRGGDEYSRLGVDFEEGMVRQLKLEFSNAIKFIENRFSVHLKDDFKVKFQLYALQEFSKKLKHLQSIWNRQNRPIEILNEKKNDYMMEIETRLKSGFSCAGEGEIAATQLCKAIRKKAIEAAYAANVEAVLSLEWTTNSEKVRLLYFEQLAKEVQSGNKDRALRHFRNPKEAIEEWYKNKVDSFMTRDELIILYESTISIELNCILSKILNSTCQEDIEGILEHATNAEDQYFSKLSPKVYDFEAFRNSLVNHLKLCLTNEETIMFPKVSYDVGVKKRLGCSEHCYWCGALCWGSRDHRVEKDTQAELECHHSCHQPSGLGGMTHRYSRKLFAISCHNRTDKWRVWFKHFQEDEGMLWEEAKRNHFSDWKFDAHCVTTFDELMRWFFQELHQDIARQRGSYPADKNDLRESKCENLKLESILRVVHSKI